MVLQEFHQLEEPYGFRRPQRGPEVFNNEAGYTFQSSVFICECMVNQAKKSRSFVCNQNRNTSQKQYKCIKLSQVKILDRNWWRDGKQILRIIQSKKLVTHVSFRYFGCRLGWSQSLSNMLSSRLQAYRRDSPIRIPKAQFSSRTPHTGKVMRVNDPVLPR